MSHDNPSPSEGTGGFVAVLTWCVENARTVVMILAIICAGLFFSDALYDKHGKFAFQDWFGFFGIFGFVVYITVVLLAKALRTVIKRPEDYYGDTSVDAEDGVPAADNGDQRHDGGDHA